MKPALVIMSMNHPDVNIFTRLSSVELDKYIFVRKNQYDMYKHQIKNGWKIVKLPDWVEEAGTTRKAMMLWLNKHGYSWAFQLDDDVAYLGNCEKRPEGWKWEYTHKGKVYFKTSVFNRWYKIAKKYKLSLSSPCHRFHDHNRHGNVIYINKAACIQCVLVYIPDVLAVGNYRDTRKYGVDDYTLQYYLMKNGYKCGMIGNLLYDSPAIGNPNDHQATIDKYKTYIKLFRENVCDDESLVSTKTTRSGIPSLQFVWKNWGSEVIRMEES